MNMKKITSLTMLITLILEVLTSVILYIVPHGRVAYWADWRLWGLTKTQWADQHLNLGILFILAAFLHLYYNWKPIVAYLKNKAREVKIFTGSFNIALILTVIFALGTYFLLPPFSTVLEFSESIKNAASEKYGEPPYGHAELSSFKLFTRKMGLDPAKSMDLLTAAGVKVKDGGQTIGDIAKTNRMTPKAVYEIMKKAQRQPAGDAAFPDSPPPGFGKRLLADICAEFNLHIPDIVSALGKKGVKADPAKSIKEIAAENDTNPMAVFEIIQAAAKK